MVIGVTALRVVPGREKSVYYALKHRDGVKEGIKDIYHVSSEPCVFCSCLSPQVLGFS
jgi:hypothetical protein